MPFVLADASREERFLQLAEHAGFRGLKGHAAVGGIRASLYNAVGLPAVEALADFMRDFQRVHG